MNKIKVISQKGTKCPKENKPRQYITDIVPVEVPNSIYYRRLISDGSLVLVVEKEKPSKKIFNKPVIEKNPNKSIKKPIKNGGLK